MSPIDSKLFRSVMGLFATGVTVVSYKSGDIATGMTANAFMSVSMDPPLVMVSVRSASRVNDYLALGGRYGVNFLAEEQENISNHFGGRPVEGLEIDFIQQESTPLIPDSLAHIVARVVDVHPAGDHVLYIGHVEHVHIGPQKRPLVFFSGKYKQVSAHVPHIGWLNTGDGW